MVSRPLRIKHSVPCSNFLSQYRNIDVPKLNVGQLLKMGILWFQLRWKYILFSLKVGNLVHFTKMQYRRSGNLYVYGAYNTYNIYNITRSGTQYGLFPISSKNQKITQPRNLSTAYSRHCRMFITTGSFLIRFPYLFMFN